MESGRIDQHNWMTVHREWLRILDFPRTRLEVGADGKFGLACKIDELVRLRLDR